MIQHRKKRKLIVLADDFTGANDAGVNLVNAELVADVVFQLPYSGKAQALIINSDSRAMDANHANEKIHDLVSKIGKIRQTDWVLKKIDSTLRGNIGSEIEALMQATGRTIAILASAYPNAGRVTIKGNCYVHGKLITETEFASDPKTPVLHANIAEIIRLQSKISCVNVTHQQLNDLFKHHDKNGNNQHLIIIVDTQTQDELKHVVSVATQAKTLPLLVGSSGLFQAFSESQVVKNHSNLFAMIGSMSEIAQKQINRLTSHPNTHFVHLDIDEMLSHGIQKYQQIISEALNQGQHCIAHTSLEHSARHQVIALCEKWALTRTQLGEKICLLLGELTQQVISYSSPKALYLSGGDVAIAAANALGAEGFNIQGQIADCVPYGRFIHSEWNKLVLTKAGAFGSEDTLFEILTFIERK
ncbi:four-carbon acid sugar kinase family protein [Providencia rettgeri]